MPRSTFDSFARAGSSADELEPELEQLLPNPIIIALIKNKFSILAPLMKSWRSRLPLVGVAANFANMAI